VPGIGLGAILSRASSVTDSMIEAASLGLANSLTDEERALDLVYPRIERIRDISAQIALSVIRAAQLKARCSTLPYLRLRLIFAMFLGCR
jgi:malate dehydrogenase (oxaloacetate-decarboxylating)(NADP+)